MPIIGFDREYVMVDVAAQIHVGEFAVLEEQFRLLVDRIRQRRTRRAELCCPGLLCFQSQRCCARHPAWFGHRQTGTTQQC